MRSMKSQWYVLLLMLFIQIPVSWGQVISFQNDREGKSLFDTKSNSKKIEKVLKKIHPETISNSYIESISEVRPQSVCAFDVNEKFIKGLGLKKVTQSQFEGSLFYLRANDYIDDVVTQILLNAYEVDTKRIYDKSSSSQVSRSLGNNNWEKVRDLFLRFESQYLQRNCYDEAYRLFHSDLGKIIRFSESALRDIFIQILNQRIISEDIYLRLERARLSSLHLKNLGLKDYFKKKSNLRNQYPLGQERERSDFVTKLNGAGLSHRQQLLLQYNEMQIILMSGLIKKLRTRLESDRIEIIIYDEAGVAAEVIPLDPMERFRFSLKLLRKEMAQLGNNSQFNGRTPTYMDLIAASFETGLIAGSELNELGGLEEIWNPKKTFWDKASFWVRSFSSVATVLIPPPYGFIPVLALVAIEATMQGKDTTIDDGSLF